MLHVFFVKNNLNHLNTTRRYIITALLTNMNILNTKLTPKGYMVLKSELPLEKQQWIRKQLTVKPCTPGAPVQSASTFSAWRENTTKMYLPRYFGEKHFGIAASSSLPPGDSISLEFCGKLRDYQQPVVDQFLAYVRDLERGGATKGRGGLLDLYPAWGKTSSGLNIVSQLGVKTLVIVGKEFLMNQWIERIEQFLPGARIGKIQGPTIDIEDKDIVLVMLQSLVSKTKDYPPELFQSFGLTILDEVHHVSSESFSRSLFSIVTRYMLGLSGTMERKDGTTDIFKMFLGEVVHRAKRPANDMAVEVRKMTYLSHDADYEDVILDFRGKPQISSMIAKMCDYNPRTEFVLTVLRDFIQSDDSDTDSDADANTIKSERTHEICSQCKRPEIYPMQTTCCLEISKAKKAKAPSSVSVKEYRCLACWEEYKRVWENNYRSEWFICPRTGKRLENRIYPNGQQIKCPCCQKKLKYEQKYVDNGHVKPFTQLQTIVFSHNLNVLRYMYRKIVMTNMCSVGMYVGGMKPDELKKSESKHVILGSYSMCSEGLDIASLNAEFLITPKTDIEQVVGRILRAKHSITSPVIFDFVDTHDNFKRQWLKRRQYYKKEKYTIVESNSDIYGTKNNAVAFAEDENEEFSDDDDETDEMGKKTVGDSNGLLKGVCFFKNLKK